MQDVMAIYRSQKKRRGRSAYLLSVEAEAVKDGKRWNIEVFFKMCKSYLKLGKETRSISYDALTALLSLLMDCAKEAEFLDEEQVNQLLDLFVAKLPDLWGKCLKQCA